jgi:hypothetical protein
MASASVEMTSGSTPCRSMGSTTTRLKSTPSATTETAKPAASAQGSDRPSFIPASTKNAGSMTNSPCAKLMVCEVCQSRTNPIATSA